MRETFDLPKEVLIWVEKMDLSYKIRNLKRDLSNGFLVAEILSRNGIKLNINLFYNDYMLEKKINNWEQISKLLNLKFKNKFKITKKEYEPVIFLAKDASLKILLKLYNEFNTKKINIDDYFKKKEDRKKKMKKKVPNYLENTATNLVANKELVRIVDNKKRKIAIDNALYSHFVNKKEKIKTMNITEFINKQRKRILEEQTNQLFNNKIKDKFLDQKQKSAKTIDLNNIGIKNENNKKNQFDLETKGTIEFLSDLIKNLIDKENLERDNKSSYQEKDPELVIKIFSNSFNYSNEFMENIFKIFIDNINDINDKIIHSSIDFKLFIKLILTFLENIEVGINIYIHFYNFINVLGNKLINTGKDFSQFMMESIGLNLIVEFALKYSNKREALCDIIFFFTNDDSLSRIRIINKLKELLRSNFREFFSIISNLSIYPVSGDYSENLWYSYNYYGLMAINFGSPYIKVFGLKIINEISNINIIKIFGIIDKLYKISKHDWWEIRAQLIIICSNLLIFIEDFDENSEEYENEIENENENEIDNKNENSNMNFDNELKEKSEYNNEEISKNISHKEDEDEFNKNNTVVENKNEEDFDRNLIKEEYQKKLLDILNNIFKINANINVIKIGLIYLAPVLNRYPLLSKSYLEILLSIEEDTRSIILNIDLDNQYEGPIVVSGISFKYKQTGAPLEWNSTAIAEALDEYIKNNNLESFDLSHIKILESCLVKKLNEEEQIIWLNIYENLKKYIFISLSYDDLCKIAFQIIIKLINYEILQNKIIESSEDLFLKILKIIYNSKTEENCKENILELFEYFIKINEKMKDFTYKILKIFAEENHNIYIETNLVEFMNELNKNRMEKLFGNIMTETFSL